MQNHYTSNMLVFFLLLSELATVRTTSKVALNNFCGQTTQAMKASAGKKDFFKNLINHLTCAILVAGLVLCSASVLAAPRAPQPPWPQASLNTFGWDSPYSQVPLRKVALNEDAASYQESWSGYALVRDSLTTRLPVIISAAGTEQRPNVAAAFGAVRFWLAPDYTSATAKGEGKGPGHYARLLELVDWSGKVPATRWSLYVNETGDTIYLSGQGKGGAVDCLNPNSEVGC